MTPSPRRLRLSRQAERDLQGILAYTLRKWGPEQRDAYEARLNRAFDELIEFPELGRARDDLGRNARSLPVEQHVIVYRVKADEIQVSRIVHGRRDLPHLFKR